MGEPEKDNSPEPMKPKNKKNKKNKNKNRKARSQSRSEEVQSPKLEPQPEPQSEPEKVSPVVADVSEKETTKEKLTEEDIKDNIADMAMSEQYLRTKQALLKAKKKEQEMKIAQKMAELREEEVVKMREKVAKMQELLSSRKTELKITEEIIQEKDGEKDNLEKRIEASRRRESYVEKKIIEKVMFEKPPKKEMMTCNVCVFQKCDNSPNPANKDE